MSKKSQQKTQKQKRKQEPTQNQTKRKFERLGHETIDQCLERMQEAGYRPVKRIENPIFKEVIENGKKRIVPAGQQIIFEGVKIKEGF